MFLRNLTTKNLCLGVCLLSTSAMTSLASFASEAQHDEVLDRAGLGSAQTNFEELASENQIQIVESVELQKSEGVVGRIDFLECSNNADQASGRVIPTMVLAPFMDRAVAGHGYDMTPGYSWPEEGYTQEFVAFKKSEDSSEAFLRELMIHMRLAQKTLIPRGLMGYVLYAESDHYVVKLRFPSAESVEDIMRGPGTEEANAHVYQFVDVTRVEFF